MAEFAILLVAVLFILVGTRGTYASIWNKLFPNMPITPGPVTSIAPLPTVQSIAQTVNNAANNPTYNPVAAGSQAGQTARNAFSQGAQSVAKSVSSLTHPSSSGSSSNVKNVNVPSGKEAVVNTGVPSWWPSWLPYPSNFPHPGEGFTGNFINIP